jgi:ABC-type tungstate transport system substrate-binding protein
MAEVVGVLSNIGRVAKEIRKAVNGGKVRVIPEIGYSVVLAGNMEYLVDDKVFTRFIGFLRKQGVKLVFSGAIQKYSR